ncbi:Uncharacterised protein [Serratia fonticola]|uniref:Uncharacterized protein n=1 Tax=Serratia fonticola TaxID=47917 RepID=A0A4U9UKT8_SERFO|nr:Uncharacterised protein [Serratia fonticola]
MKKLIYLLLFSASLANMAQAELVASSRTIFKGRITIATCNIVVVMTIRRFTWGRYRPPSWILKGNLPRSRSLSACMVAIPQTRSSKPCLIKPAKGNWVGDPG